MNHLKKVRERFLLDAFASSYAGFPKCRIISTESPDFILQPNRKSRIGLEITEYFKNVDQIASQKTIFPSEELLELITAKEEKLKAYKKQLLDQIWLVVVIDQSLLNIQIRLNEAYLTSQCPNGFNAVFLMIMPVQKIIRLR